MVAMGFSASMPKNMRVMKLPDHSSFANFIAEGPTGRSICDINGRAVAMECFLDLAWSVQASPYVRWTSYLKNPNTHQGELANKEKYTRLLMDLNRREADYNFDKLKFALNMIVSECAEIAWADTRPFFRQYL